ncbi:hypothetical protein CC80DRAFT_530364 [Byssothecium circinans]|uniref:Uncharacterized protein n=1 Tax=Byssothecium circinans TaxID=147558 RepID=A0A6A5UKS6_9PLEO|nr:hypothetical protein CC80DRAFT_530364 [Byssothecium circinans]
MSGPPPPLGQPWLINGGANVNFDRDPPPPPITVESLPPGPQPQVQQQMHLQQGIPTAIPAIGVGVGLAPPPMMGMPMPFSPFGGLGFGMGMGMGMGMPGIQSAGPLGVPRNPWNTPGLMGNPSTRLGACVPGAPGMGFPPADAPPPPPGIEVGGPVAAFAQGVPLLGMGGGVGSGFVAPGHGMGMGMPMGMGMMGMGMGMGMGGLWGGQRPAPAMITEATGLEQPMQNDITEVPGGIPPGVTHVESAEHTIVHLLKAPLDVPNTYPFYPWLNHGNPMEVEILHLSSVTGMNRMIQICLRDVNDDPAGWAISECHEMVNGIWEKGQTFVFDEAMSRVLTIKDAGWDNKRNRPGGQSLHIFAHRV